jgi:hypothetical protein
MGYNPARSGQGILPKTKKPEQLLIPALAAQKEPPENQSWI